MKLSIYILVVLAITIGSTYSKYTQGHNGQPNCETRQELEQRNWRNNFDPTKYWVCNEQRVAAKEARCLDENLFLPAENQCVHHLKWTWTEPVDPPSLA